MDYFSSTDAKTKTLIQTPDSTAQPFKADLEDFHLLRSVVYLGKSE
jgi:hypothetical protein